jgi:hypothetical protein
MRSASVPPPRTRRDASGLLQARLASMLQGGELLFHHAELIACDRGVRSFRQMHSVWVQGCLPVLADGFEPEAAVEFIHLNTRIPRSGLPIAIRRASVCAVRDALELLRGLRGTLE